jgi:hypothetical protein
MTNSVQSILDGEGVELPTRWTGGFSNVIRCAIPRMRPRSQGDDRITTSDRHR